ncbi:hypothetical protein I3842_Q098100 [Carya illinoinensis]|uniref:Uncharacterized protein n=1 Tax=Carya illinoinensis TaxID=32201 RepID=A0A922D6T6_CARIL|nr:hypothetical protein I3842_Q098100 [Carya illinoinensis]KAG6619454.1 hypothetical protein I3842_Q098100 [Carya illinoinensis]
MQKYNPLIEFHKLPATRMCHIIIINIKRARKLGIIKIIVDSESSKSSWKDLLELLENEICGELVDDIFIPKYFLVSSLPRENNCNRVMKYLPAQLLHQSDLDPPGCPTSKYQTLYFLWEEMEAKIACCTMLAWRVSKLSSRGRQMIRTKGRLLGNPQFQPI